MSKTYRCIKEFSIPILDDQSEELEVLEYFEVNEGSTWEYKGDYAIVGDIRLYDIDDKGWIEVSKKELQENFEEEIGRAHV